MHTNLSSMMSYNTAPCHAALPVATPIGTTGYCTLEEGWEYAQRWNFPDNQVSTMTMEECAELCAAHELCTGATFLDFPDNTDQKNCWMKSWASPPAPAGTPCFAGRPPHENIEKSVKNHANPTASTLYIESTVLMDAEGYGVVMPRSNLVVFHTHCTATFRSVPSVTCDQQEA